MQTALRSNKAYIFKSIEKQEIVEDQKTLKPLTFPT